MIRKPPISPRRIGRPLRHRAATRERPLPSRGDCYDWRPGEPALGPPAPLKGLWIPHPPVAREADA